METRIECDAPDTDDFVSLSEAAELLGRDQRQIYRYLKSGRLTRVTVGRHVFVRRADVEKIRDQPVVTRADRQTRVSPSGQSQSDLLTILERQTVIIQEQAATIREQAAKLEAAGYRVGFLESDNQRLKLLKAPKVKRPWWRFWG